MKIETELDAGERGHALIDNSVAFVDITEVRISQTTRYVGGPRNEPTVEYMVTSKSEGVSEQLVPANRIAKTKAELLAKL